MVVESYYPFNTGSGASIGQTKWGNLAKRFCPSGVMLSNTFMNLQPFATGSGLEIFVQSGSALVGGHLYELLGEDAMTIPISANTSGLGRKDLLVLKVDYEEDKIGFAVIEGEPSGSPIAPVYNNSGFTQALPIAEITVDNGASSILNGRVKDIRPISGGVDGVTGREVLLFSKTSSGDSFFNITDIPATFSHLRVTGSLRSTGTGTSGLSRINIKPNNDTTSNYHNMLSEAANNIIANVTQSGVAYSHGGKCPNADTTAGSFGTFESTIMGYESTSKFTSLNTRTTAITHSAPTPLTTNSGVASMWRKTDIVTSLRIDLDSGSFATGSQLRVYGVRNFDMPSEY